MNHPNLFLKQNAAALALLALALPGAMAQDLVLDSRRSQISGNYLVGYATKYVSDTFSRNWDTEELSFEFETADSGSINDQYDDVTINGLGSYEVSQHYSVSAGGISLGGQAHNTLAAADDRLSAGARATSTLWLDFVVPEASSFSFSGFIDVTPGAAVGGVNAVATGTVILERVSGGNARWAFDTPGAFATAVTLQPGDWRLYGNAHTRLNGDAIFSAALTLSPVPEPARWALCLAGLLPLSLRRRRSVAGAAAATAALLAAGPAAAVPGAVNTLGQPDWYTTYHLLTPAGFGTYEIKDHDDAVNGTTAVFHSEGTMWDRRVANQQAVVTNNGVTYWSYAMGPMLEQAPALNTVTGAVTTADVVQSFQKVDAGAELRFTYTGGRLQLFKHPEIGAPCEQGCAFAEVVWQVQVTLNSDPNTPVMTETGRAAMGILGGQYRFYSSQTASDGSPANPLWQWDCDNCGGTARNLATATLQTPFTGIVDLSAIPYDAQQPVDFTVTFSLQTTAYINREWMGAEAWARDPLSVGDEGVSIAVQGLLPTNSPVSAVPEPQTWALMLAGAAWIAWRRRSAE